MYFSSTSWKFWNILSSAEKLRYRIDKIAVVERRPSPSFFELGLKLVDCIWVRFSGWHFLGIKPHKLQDLLFIDRCGPSCKIFLCNFFYTGSDLFVDKIFSWLLELIHLQVLEMFGTVLNYIGWLVFKHWLYESF